MIGQAKRYNSITKSKSGRTSMSKLKKIGLQTYKKPKKDMKVWSKEKLRQEKGKLLKGKNIISNRSDSLRKLFMRKKLLRML